MYFGEVEFDIGSVWVRMCIGIFCSIAIVMGFI